MKQIAIISDIHANLEALTVVLEDIQQRHVDAVYCLGDVIGYGPDPLECLEKVLDVCTFILLGNHEEAVLSGAFGFNQAAKQAVDWTRRRLKPGIFSSSQKKKIWEVIKSLPLMYTEDGNLFVHASPRDPTMDYVLKTDTEDVFGQMPEKISDVFKQTDRACFIGHTHMPGIITQESKWFTPNEFDNIWELKPDEKIICNVGSVGQPRDKDCRACYVTFDNKEIFYHRIPYDFRKTQAKIQKLPQLDDHSGNRLETGN